MSTVQSQPRRDSRLREWDHRFGRHSQFREPRPWAALACQPRGPVRDHLIEVTHVRFVVLYDEAPGQERSALRLAAYGGGAVPWGVRWGGAAAFRFRKDLRLRPAMRARGQRIDLSAAWLLGLGLALEQQLVRASARPPSCPESRVSLPRLWAGFAPADVPTLYGDGPELHGLIHGMGLTARELMHRSRHAHCGLELFPLDWVSHHWEKAVGHFADLRGFPRVQVVACTNPQEDLRGFRAACEFDFAADLSDRR